jgi:phosphonate transport system substrate-binding protein
MTLSLARRAVLAAPALLAAATLVRPVSAQSGPPIRFAVGPFQPTAGDTRRAFEPFFAHLATALGRRHELTVTTDWAGIAVALGSGQADCAWMGPWGYVLAKHRAGAEALAIVTYQGRPTYHAIIIARPELRIDRFPEDARGMSISFADAGSTRGWLIPHHWFAQRGIDPRSFFRHRDGASLSLSSGDPQPKARGLSPAWNQVMKLTMSNTGRPTASLSAAA